MHTCILFVLGLSLASGSNAPVRRCCYARLPPLHSRTRVVAREADIETDTAASSARFEGKRGKVVPTSPSGYTSDGYMRTWDDDIPVTELAASSDFQRGLLTIAFCTLMFASQSPALRLTFTSTEHVPPVLLVNAAASVTALSGLLGGGALMSSATDLPSTLEADATDALDEVSLRGGFELALLKTAGVVANIYGLSLTSAGHAAFLIQLTTLIVPTVQGIQVRHAQDSILFNDATDTPITYTH